MSSGLLALLVLLEALALVPPATSKGRWTWTPGAGATAHAVYLSIDSGPAQLAKIIQMPAHAVVLEVPIGHVARVHVEGLGPAGLSSPGPPSEISIPRRFVVTTDLDQDGIVNAGDLGIFRATYLSQVCRASSGRAAVPGPEGCPP